MTISHMQLPGIYIWADIEVMTICSSVQLKRRQGTHVFECLQEHLTPLKSHWFKILDITISWTVVH